MSDQTSGSTSPAAGAGSAPPPPPAEEQQRVEAAATDAGARDSQFERMMASSFGRNLGLVGALVLIMIVGVITSGDRFADVDNVITILRLAAVIGVVSVGMTFVIIGGGIDLSVGSIVALATVWCTTVSTQTIAEDFHWLDHRLHRHHRRHLLRRHQRRARGLRPDGAVHRDAGHVRRARGLAEIISDKRNQLVTTENRGLVDFLNGEWLGIPVLVYIFALVALVGWILLNRTTFGRRTIAVGGNPEAARLAGIRVERHTVYLYVLVGVACGIAGAMLVARTGTGTAQHGQLYELDAIAAVVIGGTLLSGGRGTIVGTVLGVLIFTTLTNVFTLNDLDTSSQAVAKGLIIVGAVLLQQRLAQRSTGST